MLSKVETIENVLLTIFETPRIEKAVPVSLLMVAPSGEAKSTLIRQHSGEAVHVTDGFTSAGLWDIISSDPGNKVSYLLVPDINPTLSRQPKVVEAAIANLLTLTFDGTMRMDDGRQNKTLKHKPIGIVAAGTPEIYARYAKKWFALGLRRRIIPFYYEYSYATINHIQEKIRTGKINRADDGRTHNHDPVQLTVSPIIKESQSYDLKSLSEKFAILLGKTAIIVRRKDKKTYEWVTRNVAPIDPHMTLRILAQANAARHRRGVVNNDDIEFILGFMEFCDPEKPKQI